MKLKIEFKEKSDFEREEKIIASFGPNKLEISKDSEKWNTRGINEFLIKLVSNLTPEETIEIIFDEKLKTKHQTYKFTVELFQKFANTYNEKIDEDASEDNEDWG